jgi:hypothetical protein
MLHPDAEHQGITSLKSQERSLYMFSKAVYLLVRRSSQQHPSKRGNPPPEEHGNTPVASHRIPARHLWLFWIALLVGTLSIATTAVPHPQPAQVTGNGGPTTAARFCGAPLLVVQHFGITTSTGQPYTIATLPTTAQLSVLPRPTAKGQVFYEPHTNILCAVNAVVLQLAWLQVAPAAISTPVLPTPLPMVSPTNAPPAFPTGSDNLWSQGALTALSGIWTGFYHWAGQTIQYVEDWATETLGFMWVTPAALTYKNGIVHEGVGWMLGLMDGLIMLLLVVGGYQCMIRTVLGEPRQDVLAFLLRVLISAVVANFGTPVCHSATH